MKRNVFCAIVLIAIGLVNVNPVDAQDNGLKITITRPGEGETLYSSPASTFAAVPVTGFVSAENFEMKQLQIRLDIYEGTKVIGSLTTTPNPDGTFAFDVGINSNPVSDLNEQEQGCDSRCHMEKQFIFPTGQSTFRVTVIDPLGHKATAQRSIIVDVSGYVDVPVQVVVENGTDRAEGITVIADTRLYTWRARQYSAKTDANGRAVIRLERLLQAPTRYVIQIEPRVVNGAMATSRTPVQVTLPPGVMQVAPITLVAQVQRGKIIGAIDLTSLKNLSGLTVRAISLSSGAAFDAKTNKGNFAFANLPLEKYLIAVDDAEAFAERIQIEPQTVDLTASPALTTSLKSAIDSTRRVSGIVRDSQGNPLPIVWLANDRQDKVVRVSPTSGEFILDGVRDNALWVTAPGFWSQPVAIAERLDIALTSRLDTRMLAWGSGKIILPAQTLADVSANQISIKRGWIWGSGSGSFNIRTPELEIALQTGSFALEYVPGETNWLYVIDGQAQVVTSANSPTITLNANQMLAFGKGVSTLLAVPLDASVVRALHSGEKSQVAMETDSAITARLRDEIERHGIPAATVVLIGGICFAILLFGIGWKVWRNVRRI